MNIMLNMKYVTDDFNGNTELLLANVLYFKGDWLVEFNESNTETLCFHTKSNICENVSMMHLEDQIKYRHISDINAQVIELLYKVFGKLILQTYIISLIIHCLLVYCYHF